MGVRRFNIDLNNNFNQQQHQQDQSQLRPHLNKNGYDQDRLKMSDDAVVNVMNPLMQDTNFYYQSSNSSNVDPKVAQLRLFVSPHGTPSTNPNWTSQFKNF